MEKYKIYGFNVYSNDKIQTELLNIIELNSSSIVKDLLIKLIKTKKLVPVILDKNILHKLLRKIRRHKFTDILGTATKDRIYIFWNKNISSKHIIETIIHECMHFAAVTNYNLFFKINEKIFYEFYTNFYKEYLDSKLFDKEKLIKFIILLGKQDKGYYIDGNYYRNIEKGFEKYTRLNRKEFETRITEMLKYIDGIFDGKRINAKYIEIAFLIKKIYKQLFNGIDDRTYVGQEMYAPSEIISMLSTININHPNITKTLQIIK